MEDVLRALLRIRSVDFDSFDIVMPESPFKPIGLATAVPDFGIDTGRILIWYAPSEILPITRSELDRFEIDAPGGFHLILSERPTHSDCDPINETKFRIVSPDQVSQWIGSAVLSGDLVASAVPEDSSITESNGLSTYSNEAGLREPAKRPGVAEWAEALRTAAAVSITCSGCGWSYYYSAAECPVCGQARPDCVVARIGVWNPGDGGSGSICVGPNKRPLVVGASVGTPRSARG